MSNKSTFKVGQIKGILEGIYNNPTLRRTVVPLFMSNAGMGKTHIIEEFMREKGVWRPPFVLSQRMPFEVSGMALVDRELDKMKYYDFDFLLDLKDGDILFIDEVYNANPTTLNAFLTFLESRIMISGKKLPDIMIVGAGNPQGQGTLTPQIKRRFLQYDLEFDTNSWKDYMFKKYGLVKSISSKLCTLIQGEDYTGYNFNSPADIDKAVEMVINNIDTPYTIIVEPILNTIIKNPLGKSIKITEDRTLEAEEQISWLELIRLNKGIRLEEDKKVEKSLNEYEYVIMDKDDNVLGEIKDIETLKNMYYFTDDQLNNLELGKKTPSRRTPSLIFQKNN